MAFDLTEEISFPFWVEIFSSWLTDNLEKYKSSINNPLLLLSNRDLIRSLLKGKTALPRGKIVPKLLKKKKEIIRKVYFSIGELVSLYQTNSFFREIALDLFRRKKDIFLLIDFDNLK